ncbi:plasmid mobilization protein [Ruminococcus flavefaciens]|uniref:Mobilisation protein (MobC) n=1 Tax=Ruminococcus flavefaciens TaxID=1265 RepID=A0A1K1MY04_RUMFL|nr:plasmid mobilization relaxosome protein MobC [Ruminococcus flavefaciens]SFW28056.1 mobilisation protein (MobC) [Ruminococcus flavefaciens]
MANRVRKHMINFYVDDDELAAIRLKMEKINMNNQSLYLRKMALEGRIIKVDYSVFNDIGNSISGVSRNINQIAKRINATDNIYAEDMKQIKQTQEEIWQLLKSIELRLL